VGSLGIDIGEPLVVTELTSGREIPYTLRGNRLQLTSEIPPQETLVFKIALQRG